MKTRILPALGVILLLATPFASEAQKPKKQYGNAIPVGENRNPLPFETAINDPLNTRIYTLKNGLKVYLSQYKNAPRIQTYIAVKAGSKNDPANATGLAHYLEHMVFKGTDKYGTRDFEKEYAELEKIEALYEVYRNTTGEAERKQIYHEIDSISGVAAKYAIANEYDKMLASIGADGTNAYTSFDQTVYVNDIPANQVDNWLKIEAERFRKPVLRLFHTELEAVYEEKNRTLDSDNNKVWEAMFAGMFRNHTYGTQTTIGTIEHLKNPSMVEISRFYEKYYVPNNMAIVMSGDFDYGKVIQSIEQHFGSLPAKPVEGLSWQPEPAMTSKVAREVVGPDPASVAMGWRVGGEGTRDADMCTLLAGILYNNTAGLFDINLNQGQKVLGSACYFFALKDYGFFGCSGDPKEGQSLEEVESLMLAEIEKVKKGDFPDWLPGAVVTDLKLRKTKELENNSSRADAMLTAFVNDIKWQEYVNSLERISKITKSELVAFAQKNIPSSGYVVVYKRNGEDTNVVKVEKPSITPVDVDRENKSLFVQEIERSAPANIEPRFLDYEKDISRTNLKGGIPLLHNRNSENKLFEMYYRFEMGSNSSKLLPVAIKYIPYLSTKAMPAAAIKQELYRLGCSFNVYCGTENVWVSLSGLNDNFSKAQQLFEKVLTEPQVDPEVLKNLVADILKERQDNKLQKRIILHNAMSNFARYGPVNPFAHVLSNEELAKISPDEVKKCIAELLSYEHMVLYYGPQEIGSLAAELNKWHKVPATLKPVPPLRRFEELPLERTVYVVDYDMKQAEIVMLSNGDSYNPDMVPLITLYNNYFGGGMSSILFQDLRESKALAYSTFSRYNQPNKLHKKYYNFSYIGSQSDKLAEAMKGLSDLLTDMPKAESSFSASREMILQDMRTQRITRSQVLFSYLEARDLGISRDLRRDIFEKVQNYTFDDIKRFHKEHISGKPATVLVLGKKESLDTNVLSKYGTVRFLTLEEVFGY